MTASTIPAQISTFAAQVRAELADLPVEELEELTEGLEADLTEAYAEDLARELPDPVAYAAELRSAAGLPRRQAERRGLAGALGAIGDGARETVADVAETLRRNPSSRAVLDFLVTLRPVWWVLRAWVAVWMLMAFFGSEGGFLPRSVPWFLLLLAAVVVSIQWGRGEWGVRRIVPLVVVGNVVAALLAVPALAMANDAQRYAYADDYGYSEPMEEGRQGIALGGTSVTNIFAYDAEGEPLTDVQLFDQDGRALAPALDTYRDECQDCDAGIAADGRAWVPAVLANGQQALNVFPLSMIRYTYDDLGNRTEVAGQPLVPQAPFASVPAVQGADGDATKDAKGGDESAPEDAPKD